MVHSVSVYLKMTDNAFILEKFFSSVCNSKPTFILLCTILWVPGCCWDGSLPCSPSRYVRYSALHVPWPFMFFLCLAPCVVFWIITSDLPDLFLPHCVRYTNPFTGLKISMVIFLNLYSTWFFIKCALSFLMITLCLIFLLNIHYFVMHFKQFNLF